MGQREKLYNLIVGGRSDKNIPFGPTCTLLEHLGFDPTTKGSHHKFTREGVEELINLQETKGGKCKPYQVQQMRAVFKKYDFREEL
jgi:hypothetical protein